MDPCFGFYVPFDILFCTTLAVSFTILIEVTRNLLHLHIVNTQTDFIAFYSF